MPHPSLDLRNLSKLPANLRTIALSALEDPQAQDAQIALSHIQGYIVAGDHMSVPPNAFLPVIYDLLKAPDSRHDLPPDTELETYLPMHPRTMAAMSTLDHLAQSSSIPKKLLPDIWRRLWPRIQFQNRYIPQLCDDIKDEAAISTLHLSLIRHLAFLNSNQHPHADIDSTPGVRGLLIRIWSRGSEHLGAAADILADLLNDFMPVTDHVPDYAEIIAGAGGTPHDLASLTVKHIDNLTKTLRDNPVGTKGRIEAADWLLEVILVKNDLEVFALHGLVASIMRCALSLNARRPDRAITVTYFKCIYLIRGLFGVPPGLPCLLEGLTWSLLAVIIDCGMDGLPKNHPVFAPITEILSIICSQLVMRSVLNRVEPILQKLRPSDMAILRESAEFWASWSHLTQLATERLQMKARFEQEYDSRRFCDNIKCGRVALKTELRRCSQCMGRFYCSTTCQSVDWKPEYHAGEHYSVCRHPVMRSYKDNFSTRSRAFLRFLMHHDYLAQKQRILQLQLEFMRQTKDDPITFYTEFDYTKGEVELAVHPAYDMIDICRNSGDTRLWLDHCERRVRDPGRIQLHVAVTAEGDKKKYAVFPLRSDSPKIRDALVDLVGRYDALTVKERDRHLRSIAEVQVLELH
ncbi:hypothetical protein C8R43DRAFT_1243326 [Mycena crocata]|nr:hypothetical protein C8R43DRAFT_1243326 [Mycena crocata]